MRTRVDLRLVSPPTGIYPMEKDEAGVWSADVSGITSGAQYLYRLDGDIERPDPASHHQPEGVHRPSAVVDHDSFTWSDGGWGGLPLSSMVFYELHVGTFTSEGTFEAVVPRLDDLAALGITALEIMPVAQFPGTRNWGYDGVHPFAVQNSYGGPEGLKRLVDECHRRGLAVVLDVVYNHLGPEGNYLRDFAPYFTDSYRTPWGEAVNFDGPWSDGVRDFFIANAQYWREHFHVDALRLDAVHAIHDGSARPFLRELAERVESRCPPGGHPLLLIAESNLNEPRLTRPRPRGGYGLNAQWNDDFHHSLRTLLTAERDGYYQDYGRLDQFTKAWREGFVYTGQFSPYRQRRHGSSAADLPPEHFVVFSQNHDQVGNRMLGERLSSLVSFESLKLAAGAVLLSPCLPLLFMGEEYGETAPFQYFVDHGDPDLVEAVRRGRKEEFSGFVRQGEPPDPCAPSTFMRSRLNWDARGEGRHGVLLSLYGELLRLRRSLAPFAVAAADCPDEAEVLLVSLRCRAGESLLVLCFSRMDAAVGFPALPGSWSPVLDTAAERWGGPGSSLSSSVEKGDTLALRGRSLALFLPAGEGAARVTA